jgi:CheY-like chemotaxis protein
VIGLEPGQADFGILIAEDNPDSRSVLRQLLESAGFNVIEAANGQEAVEQYKNQSPDMIWMDIRLPVMSGVEATKRIRKLEEKSTIQNPKSKIDRLPIVALSASSFEEDREEFLAAGCDDFVRKPFRAEEIFNVMAKYMEVRYIYQDIQTPVEKPVTPALTSADMANLPVDLCQQINTLAKGAMSKQLLNVFKQIPPDFRYVADALAAHVSQYQFARIITLTEKENKDD